jgi:hypothetical protein
MVESPRLLWQNQAFGDDTQLTIFPSHCVQNRMTSILPINRKRIGLIRHFPVAEGLPQGWVTAGELLQWRERYDTSATLVRPVDLGSESWAECLCSDLPRAVATAEAAYAATGAIERTGILREATFAPFATGALRLPLWVWRWVLRLAWTLGFPSQRACRDEFRSRVKAAADVLEARQSDVLVVSHAGMMVYLSAELRRRGYVGPKLRMPEHAVLYTFYTQ